MRLIAMLLLFSALTVTTAFADAPTTAQGESRVTIVKVFFEPTQADYDCCNSAIMDQQDRYAKAKAKGDYDEAVLNALFFWTRAWLHFNEAVKVGVVDGQWVLDTDKLTEALGLLDKAETDAKAAKGAGTSKDCLAKVRANRASIKGHLKHLETK